MKKTPKKQPVVIKKQAPEWSEQAIKLVGIRIFNDYSLAISSKQNPEAESFFEQWMTKFISKDGQKHADKIWKIFIDLLWLRVRQ